MQNRSTWTLSPPSRMVWPSDTWAWGRSLLLALALIVVQLGVPIAIVVVSLVLHPIHARSLAALSSNLEFLRLSLIAQIVSYVPLAALLIVVLPRLSQTSLAGLGFRRPTGRELAIAVGAAVVMFAAVDVAGALSSLTGQHETEQAVELARKLRAPGDRLMFVSVAIVFAPLAEELIFRVFVFNALSRYVSTLTAIVLSGILFGLVHSIPPSTAGLISIAFPLAVGGCILAYVYATTRNYWSNAITHSLFNTIQIVGLLVFNLK